jgi:hypothetical protein
MPIIPFCSKYLSETPRHSRRPRPPTISCSVLRSGNCLGCLGDFNHRTWWSDQQKRGFNRVEWVIIWGDVWMCQKMGSLPPTCFFNGEHDDQPWFKPVDLGVPYFQTKPCMRVFCIWESWQPGFRRQNAWEVIVATCLTCLSLLQSVLLPRGEAQKVVRETKDLNCQENYDTILPYGCVWKCCISPRDVGFSNKLY